MPRPEVHFFPLVDFADRSILLEHYCLEECPANLHDLSLDKAILLP